MSGDGPTVDGTDPSVLSSLPGFVNFRPIGGADLETGYRLQLYRSNTPARLTDDDRRTAAGLLDAVVDLRSEDERGRTRHPLAGEPGYRALPYLDPDHQEPFLAGSPDLLRLAVEGSTVHRRTLRAVFAGLAAIPSGRVLVCCAAGKDRTGLVSALVARLRSAPDEVVARDYAETAARMADLFAAELSAAVRPEAVRALQRSDPETITTFIAHIEQTYGTVAGYLAWLGVTDGEVAALRARTDG